LDDGRRALCYRGSMQRSSTPVGRGLELRRTEARLAARGGAVLGIVA
jgi:hypothetical protein